MLLKKQDLKKYKALIGLQSHLEERKEMKKDIRLYLYIGETSRSVYERALEHSRDFNEMKKDSHMIKHYFDKHEEEDI